MERWNLKRWAGADGTLASEDNPRDTARELHLPTVQASPSAKTAVEMTGPDSALLRATEIRLIFLMKTTTFT
jgi:hypothetical protein